MRGGETAHRIFIFGLIYHGTPGECIRYYSGLKLGESFIGLKIMLYYLHKRQFKGAIMQAVKGHFLNGFFTPLEKVTLPARVEAVLVYEDITTEQLFKDIEINSNREWLNRIKKSLELSRDEDLTNFPKQGTAKTDFIDCFGTL